MEEKKENKVVNSKVEKQNSGKKNNTKASNMKKTNVKANNVKKINKVKNESEKNVKTELKNEPVKEEYKEKDISVNDKNDETAKIDAQNEESKVNSEENASEKVTINVTVPKDKTLINNLITLFISFILFNIKWIKYKFEFFGYVSSSSITILHSDMFDFSFLLGMSKIFAIISILVFFVTIINAFIKLDEHIPSLKSFNLDKNLFVIYYGSYAISLILALIGVLFTKYSYLTIGYALTLIGYIVCAYLTFKKDILKETKKLKEDISC